MSLPPDYHMHTPLCRHASGEPGEYAAQAIRIGLAEIGFSDHAPMRRDDFDNWRMRLDQLDAYVDMVRKAQRDFPQLTIKLGLELDYLPGQEAWIRELSARHPWDYLIGSVHYVDGGWDVDNPAKIDEWKKHDPWEVWSAYFDWLARAADSGLFDLLGHADLPKKFGYYPHRDCQPLYERFLDAAQRHNVAIELNTAGLRKECREIYPSPAVLQLAARKGISITFGSDAHTPAEVGLNFVEAVELARRAGYTHSCRFARRQRERWPLD
jgi:histidinol-phosphatase (PHP family)